MVKNSPGCSYSGPGGLLGNSVTYRPALVESRTVLLVYRAVRLASRTQLEALIAVQVIQKPLLALIEQS